MNFLTAFQSRLIIKPSQNTKWTQNVIVPVGYEALPGLQKPTFPGLSHWRSHENLQRLVVLSTSTSSIFVISIFSTQSYLYPPSWPAWESLRHCSYTRLLKHTSYPSNNTMQSVEKTSVNGHNVRSVCALIAKNFSLHTKFTHS